MGIPRQYETQQVHYLRRDFSYQTANIANGILLGTVPSGSRIVSVRIFIDTPFNAGTVNLQGGTTATGANLFSNTDAAPTTAGAKRTVDAAGYGAGLVITQDQDLFIQLTQSGAAGTAGAGGVIIDFVPLSNGG